MLFNTILTIPIVDWWDYKINRDTRLKESKHFVVNPVLINYF